MSEQTTTPATGAESDSEALSGEGQGIVPQEPSEGSERPMPREQRYRLERNSAREELAAAQQRIDSLLTREAERVASKHLAEPSDLFTVLGKTVKDFIDPETGELDVEAVTNAANELIGSRPGLGKNTPAFDPSQGRGGGTAKPKTTFADLFKS